MKSVFWQRNSGFLAVCRWHVGKTLPSQVVATFVGPRGRGMAKEIVQGIP